MATHARMPFEIRVLSMGNDEVFIPQVTKGGYFGWVTNQRKRDDNKIKICVLLLQGGGGQGGREEPCPKCYFSWETPRQ